jgi:hypothetical protein
MSIYACMMTRKKHSRKLKISNRNFFQIWMAYTCTIDKKQFIRSTNYSILNSMFYPSYLYNISLCFMLSVNIFSLIFNEVLISLHHCLDSTHTNRPAGTREVFKYILYDYFFILYALIINVIILAWQKVHVVRFNNQDTTNLLHSTIYNEVLCYYIWGS